MGWFKDILGWIGGTEPTDYTLVRILDWPGRSPVPIVPDECYVELHIESLRIDKDRSFATLFHGVVYSFASLAKIAEADVAFAAVTKPDKLAELDKDSVGKVLTVSKKMLGPVAWRGGQLELQLGLFSVKSGNVLTPLLNFVTKVSETAGIAFIGAVKPFVPLISDGMDLIAGQTQDTKLVVGIDTALDLTQSAHHAIIHAPKGSIDASRLTIDPADGKLLLDGQSLNVGYCVFSIASVDRKADFGEIPELKASFAKFREAVVAGKEDDARETFAAFRRTAIASPDLISADALRLVAKAKELLINAFGSDVTVVERGGGVAIKTRGGAPAALPAQLAQIALYEG